jgi:hypothetical protein
VLKLNAGVNDLASAAAGGGLRHVAEHDMTATEPVLILVSEGAFHITLPCSTSPCFIALPTAYIFPPRHAVTVFVVLSPSPSLSTLHHLISVVSFSRHKHQTLRFLTLTSGCMFISSP